MYFNRIIYNEKGITITTLNEYINYCYYVENEVLKFLKDRNAYISTREFNTWFRNKFKCDLKFLKNAFIRNFPTFKFESHPFIISKIKSFMMFKYKLYFDEVMNKLKLVEIYDNLLKLDPCLKGLNESTVKTVLFEIRLKYYKNR